MYSSTLSLTSALDAVGGQRHTPAALQPRKTRYPLYRRLGGPQRRAGQVRNISPSPGFYRRIVQPVASRYTNCAIQLTWRIIQNGIHRSSLSKTTTTSGQSVGVQANSGYREHEVRSRIADRPLQRLVKFG